MYSLSAHWSFQARPTRAFRQFWFKQGGGSRHTDPEPSTPVAPEPGGLPFVFVASGPCGGGRSSFVAFLHHGFGFGAVRKITDRPARPWEGVDLGPGDPLGVSAVEFSRRACTRGFYSYGLGGFRYGFAGSEVVRALSGSGAAAVIVSSPAVLQCLRRDFRAVARVVAVWIDADDAVIRGRLVALGRPEAEVAVRMSRSAELRAAYVAHPGLYDVVIGNNSTQDQFAVQVARLVQTFVVSGEVAA